MYSVYIYMMMCVYALEESINAIHMRSATELHVFPPEVGILQLVSVQRSRDIDVFSADADHLPSGCQIAAKLRSKEKT